MKDKLKRLKEAAMAAVMAAVLVSLGFMLPDLTHDFALATSPHDEHFTELYFNNLPALTQQQPQKGQLQRINFTLTNHEGTAISYQYRVSIIENGIASTQDEAVTLQSGQSASLPIAFTPRRANAAIEVVVELPLKNQKIYYRSHS